MTKVYVKIIIVKNHHKAVLTSVDFYKLRLKLQAVVPFDLILLCYNKLGKCESIALKTMQFTSNNKNISSTSSSI